MADQIPPYNEWKKGRVIVKNETDEEREKRLYKAYQNALRTQTEALRQESNQRARDKDIAERKQAEEAVQRAKEIQRKMDEDNKGCIASGKPRMHGGNKELLLEMFSKMLDMYEQMKNKGYDDEDDYIGNALQAMLEEIQNDAITIEQLRNEYDELKWAYEHICLITGEEKEEKDEKEEPPATGDGRNRFRPHRGS